jgi:acetoin utilization deacetylase AcuC-like enzyme
MIYSGLRYKIDLLPTNPFPQGKHELVRETLVHRGVIREDAVMDPTLPTDDVITQTHSAAYWQRVKNLELSAQEQRKLGLPLSHKTVQRALASAGSTLMATQHALRHGLGINLGGGTHHAFYDRAEGYCLLNDVALSANQLLSQQVIRRALVVDLDVHQGNGTAALFAQDARVFTFSMHCAVNYPLHKEHSNLDIELPPHTGDEAYLELLAQTLPSLLARHKPDVVYYIAGADVLATDRIGKLALTLQGMGHRDTFVYEQVAQFGAPLVLTLGGGYPRQMQDVVDAHAQTITLALEHFS